MVIIKCRAGFANQLYQFAAGYALAKERNDELIIDISYAYNGSCMGYMLDNLKIPKCKKIQFDFTNNSDLACFDKIPVNIINNAVIYSDEVERVNDVFPLSFKSYNFLGDVSEEDKNIVLVGTFQRQKYYNKYLDDIRKFFVPKKESYFLQLMKRYTKEYVCIGVHIRRRVFVLRNHYMQESYYKAAIQYFEENGNKCEFFFFSDDIDWVMEVFQNRENYHFVKSFGGLTSDMDEFFALSMCKHKILTNISSYGRMASLLQDDPGQKIIYYSEEKKESIDNIIYLSKDSIVELENRYYQNLGNLNSLCNINLLNTVLQNNDYNNMNCFELIKQLNMIEEISINTYGISSNIRNQLLYNKMKIVYYMKDYKKALEYLYILNSTYEHLFEYNKYYLNTLIELDAIAESNIIKYKINMLLNKNKYNTYEFIISPIGGFIADCYINRLIALGILLRRTGNNVTFFCSEHEKHSIYSCIFEDYLKHYNNNLMDTFDNDYQCKIYDYNDKFNIINNKIQMNNINTIVVISDNPEFLRDIVSFNDLKKIFIHMDSTKLKEPEIDKYDDNLIDYIIKACEIIITDKDKYKNLIIKNSNIKFVDINNSYDKIIDSEQDISDIYMFNEYYVKLAIYIMDILNHITI